MARESSYTGDRVVIYPSRGKTFLILLGSIAFVAVGIWVAIPYVAAGLARWKVVFVSFVGIPVFGLSGLYAADRLVSPRPAVEVDSTGFTDRASLLGVGHLRWDEIESVFPYEFWGQPMLGIVPRDVDALLSRQNAFRRVLIRLNLRVRIGNFMCLASPPRSIFAPWGQNIRASKVSERSTSELEKSKEEGVMPLFITKTHRWCWM